jgi:uncharacterized membrane protein YidH (DUF202 family)
VNWPFEVLGAAFAAVGVAFVAYGYVRQKAVEVALARGEYAPLPHLATLVFAGIGVLLGLGTLVVVLVHPG